MPSRRRRNMVETQVCEEGSPEEEALLRDGWRAIARAARRVDKFKGALLLQSTKVVDVTYERRNKILSCHGCIHHRPMDYVCRRHPRPEPVDGKGCGDYE